MKTLRHKQAAVRRKESDSRAAKLRGLAPSSLNLSAGFTLIETLVAISIIAIAIAGPLFTASRALAAAEISRDELTASALAQEGIEYVRLMRDQAYLAERASDPAWTRFLTGAATESVASCRASTCTLDPARNMGTGASFALSPCSGNACAPLYLADGVYTEQSGIPGATVTPFRRTVQVLDIAGTADGSVPYPEKRVVSTVWWTFRGTPYTVSVSDTLSSWQ